MWNKNSCFFFFLLGKVLQRWLSFTIRRVSFANKTCSLYETVYDCLIIQWRHRVSVIFYGDTFYQHVQTIVTIFEAFICLWVCFFIFFFLMLRTRNKRSRKKNNKEIEHMRNNKGRKLLILPYSYALSSKNKLKNVYVSDIPSMSSVLTFKVLYVCLTFLLCLVF